jgi:hypothetical protein
MQDSVSEITDALYIITTEVPDAPLAGWHCWQLLHSSTYPRRLALVIDQIL